MIPRDFIDTLLARVDVVDVIDRRVPLKKAGQNYQACCPFHSEKTPSFTVSPTKQFYHCFGCGAHGTALGFLMEYEHMSFPDAVAALAQDVGLPVPEPIQFALRRLIGTYRAERLLTVGAMIDSERALALGFVDELVDTERVVARALDHLLKFGPVVVGCRRPLFDKLRRQLPAFAIAVGLNRADLTWNGEFGFGLSNRGGSKIAACAQAKASTDIVRIAILGLTSVWLLHFAPTFDGRFSQLVATMKSPIRR